ncbi:MAG: hypothetical protein IPM98_21570 [Lewinellaceae bacterium]|nr:hypothetical protein [Lewinellaceae bacterium]
MMLTRVLLLFACTCFASGVQAQKNFGKFIIGLESGFDVGQYTEGLKPRIIPALHAELPIGRLSVGAGIGTEVYREYEYYTWTGEIVERIENDKPVPHYVSTLRAFRPAYWTVPIQVNYRLHRCHCVFLHAGMTLDFFSDHPAERIAFEGAQLRQAPLTEVRRDQLFKQRTTSYNFGVGFNLYANDLLRITARPSYVLSENPEIYTNAPDYISTVRMTFGVQFALFK